MGKLPGFVFYPGDWLKDPNLRRCSHAAKGVWIDMMCLMFECDERGVLASGGVPWTRDEIAAAVGGDPRCVHGALDELLRLGVVSLTAGKRGGAFTSRRMVRDEEQRADERSRQQKRYNRLKTIKVSTGNITQNLTRFPEDESVDERVFPSNHREELRPKTAKSPPPLPSPEADVSLFSRVLCERLGVFGIQEQSSMHKLFDSYVRHSGRELGQAVEHMTARWEQYQEAIPALSWTYGSAFKFFMSGQWNKPEQWPRKEQQNGSRLQQAKKHALALLDSESSGGFGDGAARKS